MLKYTVYLKEQIYMYSNKNHSAYENHKNPCTCKETTVG